MADQRPPSVNVGRTESVAGTLILQLGFLGRGAQTRQRSVNNSPGHGPIGVLDLGYSLGSFWNVPRPRKVGGPGASVAKVGRHTPRQPPLNLRQGHGDLLFAMDSFDAFTIDPKNEVI